METEHVEYAELLDWDEGAALLRVLCDIREELRALRVERREHVHNAGEIMVGPELARTLAGAVTPGRIECTDNDETDTTVFTVHLDV